MSYGGSDSLNRRGRTSTTTPVHIQSFGEQQQQQQQQPQLHTAAAAHSSHPAAYGQFTPGAYHPPAPHSFAAHTQQQQQQQPAAAAAAALPYSTAASVPYGGTPGHSSDGSRSAYGSQPASPYSHGSSHVGYGFPTSSFPTDGSSSSAFPAATAAATDSDGYTNGHGADFSSQRPYSRNVAESQHQHSTAQPHTQKPYKHSVTQSLANRSTYCRLAD